MKRIPGVGWLSLITFLALSIGVRGAKIFASEDGGYSVDLSQGDRAEEVVVSVSRMGEGRGTLQWSRKTDWPNPRGFPSLAGSVEALVSNDGQTVILQGVPSLWMEGVVTAVRRNGECTLEIDELDRLLGLKELPFRNFFRPHPHTGLKGPAMLNFIWESKGWFCLFHPAGKEWLVIGLKDLQVRKANESEKLLLDEEGRKRALKLVQEHQPGPVKEFLNALRRKAGTFVPGIAGQTNSFVRWNRVAPAYELLAAQRRPEDRKWLQELLKGGNEDMGHVSGHYRQDKTTFLLHSTERALADGLLSEWDGLKSVGTWVDLEPLDAAGKLNLLGAVRGEVRLPVPPATNSGNLVAFLIPAELKKGGWETRTSVIRMTGQLTPKFGRQDTGVGVDRLSVIFSTVPPGEYRLKAVWDKRAPQDAGEPGGTPSPGDYESAETEAFVVKAGEVTRGLVLECTNRVGSAAGFYAEDMAWKERVKSEGVLADAVALREGMDRGTRKLLFEAPLEEWVLKREPGSDEKVRLESIAVVEGEENRGEPAQLLQVKVWHREGTRLTGRLVDEHGCRFLSKDEVFRGGMSQISDLRFAVFPRMGAFKLEVSTAHNDAMLGSWMLTNAAPAKTETFEPEALPTRREIGEAVVELRSIAQATDAEIGFAEGSDEWELKQVEYLDETGNRAGRLSALCRKLERVKVEAVVHRKPRHQVPAELKWTVPMEGYPDRGEFRNLGLEAEVQGVKFKLLAITGQGEFAYENFRVVEGKEEFDRYAPRMSGWAGGNGSVFVKMEANDAYAFNPSRRHTVVSRVPHVSVQVEGAKEEQMWALLEERIPIYHGPRHSSERATLFYLPINRPKLKETQGLTFVVFESKTVEFVVELGE